MKLRRILAASTAAAIVASAMAVTSFADEKAFSGSVTVKSAGDWWTQADIDITTLIGDINPADVTKIVVTTDNAVTIQYMNPEYTKVAIDAGGTAEITDASLDAETYFFSPAVSSGDTTYTANVSWDVYADVAASDDTTTDDTTDGDEIVGDDDATTDGDEIVGGDDVVDEGDSAVAPMEKPIVITVDNGSVADWGADGIIDYTVLEQFEGDVLVTVDVDLMVDDAHTYWLVAPANYWGWTKVPVTILDDTAYYLQPDGFINIEDNTTTQVQFVLGAAEVDALLASVAIDEQLGYEVGGMLFQVCGADVTSVTFDDYVPAAEGDDIIDEGTAAVEGIDCVYVADAPSYTCTVVADIDTLPVDVVYAPADGDAFNFNDWCGNGVIVTMADGTKTYYQWGGAQVTWGWDIDDDKNEESVGGVNGETWLGSVNSEDLTAQLSIPVEKGAVVEFYTLGWDAYEGTQYTLVIDEALITEGAAEDGDSAGNTEGADDENKNSADTGVEGIAVAAGALALAGAAVIASRKRK